METTETTGEKSEFVKKHQDDRENEDEDNNTAEGEGESIISSVAEDESCKNKISQLSQKPNLLTLREEAALLTSKSLGLMYVTCSGAVFVSGCYSSSLSAFWPRQAALRGATATEVGIAFACLRFPEIFLTPLMIGTSRVLNPKTLLISTVVIQNLIQGFGMFALEFLHEKWAFLGLSYFIEFTNGVCFSTFWGAVVRSLVALYPDMVPFLASSIDLFLGIGISLGPLIALGLYQLWNFGLIFLVFGCIGLGFGGLSYYTFPNVQRLINRNSGTEEGTASSTEKRPSKGLRTKAFFLTPALFCPLIDVLVALTAFGFIDSMIALHFMDLGFAEDHSAFFFAIYGAVSLFSLMVVGWICYQVKYISMVKIWGNVLLAISMLMSGPADFFPVPETDFSVVVVNAVILGLGLSIVIASTFSGLYDNTIKLGYRDELDTYIILTSVWSSVFFTGRLLGALLGGLAVQNFGYRTACVYFYGPFVLLCIKNVLEFVFIDHPLQNS